MSHEVLQQALQYVESNSFGGSDTFELIAALREALAQQDAESHLQAVSDFGQLQEPFGYFKPETFGWTDCAETDEGAMPLYEKPFDMRQTEQEPAATVIGKFLTRNDELRTCIDPELPLGTKLYTSPKRQPLTEEEILKCFAESDGTFISSVRAIEAAHGIGDKT